MIIAGIDPGANGGLAWWQTGSNTLMVLEVPKKKGVLLEDEWAVDWRYYMASCDHIFIERVHNRPRYGKGGKPVKMGATSMFNFGDRFGFVKALAYSTERKVHFVEPQEWKKGVGIPTGSEKGASRIRASQLFPNDADKWSRVKDDGLAEAALIAYYGSLKLRGEK